MYRSHSVDKNVFFHLHIKDNCTQAVYMTRINLGAMSRINTILIHTTGTYALQTGVNIYPLVVIHQIVDYIFW